MRFSCFSIKLLIFVIVVLLCIESGCVRQSACEMVDNSLYESGVLIALSKPRKWSHWDDYHIIQTAYFIPGNASCATIDSVISGTSSNYYIIEGNIPKKIKKEMPCKVNVALRYKYQGFVSRFPIRYFYTYRICCLEKIES